MARNSEGSFKIEAEEVKSLMKEHGYSSSLQLLASLVKPTKKMARPSISNYHVGAVGLGSRTGQIFMGVNLEFPGLPLHHTVHAEQFLIANAFLNSQEETQLSYIAVSSAPCGHCRQFMQEIRSASDIEIIISEDGNQSIQSQPLSYFLPQRFGPDDLLDKDVPLLLEPHQNSLVLVDHGSGSGCCCNGGGIDGSSSMEALKVAALRAANRAHAPYSNCPSGVALMVADGRVFAGSYMESAAFNPSLMPVQAALVAFVAGGGGVYGDIVAAVLVEKRGAVVGQESSARLLLETISPNSSFHVFHCEVMK